MKLLIRLAVLIFCAAVVVFFAAEFLMELWWFSSLKLGGYFVLRENYEWLVKLGTTVLLTSLVYLNFVFIPRALSLQHSYNSRGLLALLIKHKKTLCLLSLFVVIPLLIPVYANWERFLLFYFGAQSELVDPAYGKNISYYLFSYPVYELIQTELFWFFALLLTCVSCFYYALDKKYKQSLQEFPALAKAHITLIVAILIALQAWSIALERIAMLFEDRHLPVFYGPGFIEMNYHLSLVWVSFLLFLGAGFSAVYFIYTGHQRKLVIGLGLAYIAALGVKNFDFIPNLIDDYYVGSNPVVTEAKYIKRHIKATADAFNFADITLIDYSLVSSLTPINRFEIRKELDNIPVWDDDLILPVFDQLQSIRPYFSFNEVAVDRYKLGARNVQVNIAARELDYQSLAGGAKNWRNKHLVYTHGNGMVMSPSSQPANQPIQWILSNFGQTVRVEKLKLSQPEIYYGLADYPYAIVPNTEALKTAASTLGDMHSDYQGSGGLALSSLITKAVAAIYFHDERIFFSAGINNKSRLLVRRNINNRIKTIAPFLALDSEPYPVLLEHKIYWIVDAYTSSNHYPLVESVRLDEEGEQEEFNYARNSVKIIIDAYNGSLDFYVVDQKDPIIRTYRRIYPSLFKDLAAMPKPLIKHLSYPKAWFKLQMQQYARFHQTDPTIFYQQSEALELANMDDKPVEPYFLTLDIDELPGSAAEEQEKFVLVSPLSPLGRENLDSVAIAGCLGAIHCQEHYQDDIYIYKFSKQIQVDGPAQVSSLINQNPDISRQFSLWNQRGSKVIRGRIIIVPMEHSLLYIQPLYLAATTEYGFPSLVKVIVAMNRHTAMADSLTAAFEQLQKQAQITQGTEMGKELFKAMN